MNISIRKAGRATILDLDGPLKLGDAEDFCHWEWVWVIAAEEVEMLTDAEGFGDAGHLQHGSNTSASGGVAGVAAEDPSGAGCRGDETKEQLDCGGFAGAIGAEKGDDFAGV